MGRSYNEDTGQVSFTPEDVQDLAYQLQQAGYIQDMGPLTQGKYTSGAGGQSFPDTQSYFDYLYGKGVMTPQVIDGQTYFTGLGPSMGPQNGATPISYNPPDSMGAQLTKAGILGLAGAGLTGMLPGTENVFGSLVGAPTGGTSMLPELGANVGSGAIGEGLGGSVVNSYFPAAAELGTGAASAGGASLLPELGAQTGLGQIGQNLGSSVVDSYFPSATNLGGSTPSLGNVTSAVNAASNVANAGGTAAPATTAGTSAIGRILGGNATDSDWASVLGTLGATGLGLAGANSQTNALKDVYNSQMALGAPYRDLLSQSYSPNFSMADQPDFKNALDIGSQSVLSKLSASGGNPYGNPGAMAEANKYVSGSLALPQLNTYRSQLGSFGQLGTNTAGTAAIGGAQSQGGTYNALGYGLGQLTQPDNPFKGLLNNFKISF